MKKVLLNSFVVSLFFLLPVFLFSQVGIETTTPKGQLDVVTITDLGLVVPRVSSIENVTDGSGNLAVNGTVVYDNSRNKFCYRINDAWICMGKDATGNVEIGVVNPIFTTISNYVKASNTDAGDVFGSTLGISADGSRFIIGAGGEDSSATGVNSNQIDNSSTSSGAAYVYSKTGGIWIQEAYLKASNTGSPDGFGRAVAISGDGVWIAVGAPFEKSNATGINGNQLDNSFPNSGAVYIFKQSGGIWTQVAYVKASNTDPSDGFGSSVSLNENGSKLAVGAYLESSNATGINGNQSNNSMFGAGAVYVFNRVGNAWSQEAYIKASNTNGGDGFGNKLSLSGNGQYLAVGAEGEDSNATGVNGNQNNNSFNDSGAVYIFKLSGNVWSQETYLKASNTGNGDEFGHSIMLDKEGETLICGAWKEDSNGNQNNNSKQDSGAVYMFKRNGVSWVQETYLKASTIDAGDLFGVSVSITIDGSRISVGANSEDSIAIGINGNEADNSAFLSGAAYVFSNTGNGWNQESYIKSSNNESGDSFGQQAILSYCGNILIVTATGEDSNATGINGNQSNNSANLSGAAYVIE